MGKIIAFSGKATSGKTTAARWLQERLGGQSKAQVISFAMPLKEKALADFGDVITAEDILKNKTKKITLGGRETTVRQLLIDLGMLYRQLDKDFWCRKGCAMADTSVLHGMHAIIDDMRFPNEYDMLKNMGATLIRIERPGIPIICDESEWALDEYEFPARIVNDGSIDDLGLAARVASGLNVD
jgi:hypothetical protein